MDVVDRLYDEGTHRTRSPKAAEVSCPGGCCVSRWVLVLAPGKSKDFPLCPSTFVAFWGPFECKLLKKT